MKSKSYMCYENGFTGTYTLLDMVELYDKMVNKLIYPTFDEWLLDMVNSGMFVEKEM